MARITLNLLLIGMNLPDVYTHDKVTLNLCGYGEAKTSEEVQAVSKIRPQPATEEERVAMNMGEQLQKFMPGFISMNRAPISSQIQIFMEMSKYREMGSPSLGQPIILTMEAPNVKKDDTE